MTYQNFEKQMEDWATREAEAAPKLQPTAEMIRLVEAKAGRTRGFWTQPRRVIATIALSALILLVFAGIILAVPLGWYRPAPSQHIAFVEQRQGPDIPHQTPDKGKGRGSDSFQQLIVQVHHGDDGTIDSQDPREPTTRSISVTPQDGFRLLIQPTQPRFLYIYLSDPGGNYLALHPEIGFNPLNPLKPTLLPASPDWFYLSTECGAYHLSMITSRYAMPELEKRYQRYFQQPAGPNLESARSLLEEYLQTIREDETRDLEVWELTIYLQE